MDVFDTIGQWALLLLGAAFAVFVFLFALGPLAAFLFTIVFVGIIVWAINPEGFWGNLFLLIFVALPLLGAVIQFCERYWPGSL